MLKKPDLLGRHVMSKPYLKVTYRQGKPIAAYLYLDRRRGDVAAHSKRQDDFVVDYTEDGRPIGVELIRLCGVNVAKLNEILSVANTASVASDDLAPLSAA